jgi:hypothetical protein
LCQLEIGHRVSGSDWRGRVSAGSLLLGMPMSESVEILGVIQDSIFDEAGHGVTAERFTTDPLGWKEAAEDWGVLMVRTYPTPDEAQADAERCRAALVRAGWLDQARAEVLAHFDHSAAVWRGASTCTSASYRRLSTPTASRTNWTANIGSCAAGRGETGYRAARLRRNGVSRSPPAMPNLPGKAGQRSA